VTENDFVDFYEVLQVSQQADAETIERVFRLLAKRYHPDNPASGDDEKFRQVQSAHEILGDPEQRAKYDVQYDRNKSLQWQIFGQSTALGSHEDDKRIFSGVLSLLYTARRRDPERGGLGGLQLEQLLGVPREHLEFPIWVLKKRGWVEVLDSGQIAITVDGIDQVIGNNLGLPDDRLLTRVTQDSGVSDDVKVSETGDTETPEGDSSAPENEA
jgi:curved DNA-binding protein CbpA